MTIQYYTKLVKQIGGGSFIDIDIGGNGGILLGMRLYSSPFTYFNINTDEEAIKNGDIHCLIADSSTARSLIGQTEVTPVPDVIVVPILQDWTWEHPDAGAIRSSQIASKLRHYSGYVFQPDAVIVAGGKLRIVASYDPDKQVVHNLGIEAEVLKFD